MSRLLEGYICHIPRERFQAKLVMPISCTTVPLQLFDPSKLAYGRSTYIGDPAGLKTHQNMRYRSTSMAIRKRSFIHYMFSMYKIEFRNTSTAVTA